MDNWLETSEFIEIPPPTFHRGEPNPCREDFELINLDVSPPWNSSASQSMRGEDLGRPLCPENGRPRPVISNYDKCLPASDACQKRNSYFTLSLLIIDHLNHTYFISTTQRTQSPCFICSKALLMADSGSRWVINSSTLSWPLR